jgi:hypothetical protein
MLEAIRAAGDAGRASYLSVSFWLVWSAFASAELPASPMRMLNRLELAALGDPAAGAEQGD